MPDWPEHSQDVGLHPVPLADALRVAHYQTVSIETLLWLFHYLHDTAVSPAFDLSLHRAWGAYREVNDLLAERLASACDWLAAVLEEGVTDAR